MNVFGIGLPEMALILAIALLVFGPKKLPEVGRSLGKAIKGFQDASKDFENEFQREAEQIKQSVQANSLPQASDTATSEPTTSESNNHTAASSGQG